MTLSNQNKCKSPQFFVRSHRQDIVDDMYRSKSSITYAVFRQHDEAHQNTAGNVLLQEYSRSFSDDLDASNDVFDIIHSRMQFECIPNARSQRFLTEVHMHKLMATMSVYPAKKKKSASNRRSRSDRTATLFRTRHDTRPCFTKMSNTYHHPGLDIGLWQPLARGASESENPLAPQKIHWPPQKHVMTQMFSRREFMISRVKLQTFVH